MSIRLRAITVRFAIPFLLVFANCRKRVQRVRSFTSGCSPTERAIQRMSRNISGETFHTQESLKV
jgi:hypothetical protein